MGKTIRQHYVPRCYLKNFSSDKRLHVFDKALQKTWNSPIESISSERYFYDVNFSDMVERNAHELGVVQTDAIKQLDEQLIEKYFSEEIESRYANHLKSIISTFNMSNLSYLSKVGVITKETKYELSTLLAYQIVRTREFRESLIQGQEVLTKKMFEIFVDSKGHSDLIGNFDVEFNREFEALEHAAFILNQDLINKLADTLFRHIWMFGYNDTPNLLYTSDNPIVKRANINHPYQSYNGYASKGIEIALPINGKIILILYEKEYFGAFNDFDMRCYGKLDKDNVDYFNSMQVNDSYRQVYSSCSDFSLASKMCKENKLLKDIDRIRVVSN